MDIEVEYLQEGLVKKGFNSHWLENEPMPSYVSDCCKGDLHINVLTLTSTIFNPRLFALTRSMLSSTRILDSQHRRGAGE